MWDTSSRNRDRYRSVVKQHCEFCSSVLEVFRISLGKIGKITKEQRKNSVREKQRVFPKHDMNDLKNCDFSIGFFSHFSLRPTFQFITNEQRCFRVRPVLLCSALVLLCTESWGFCRLGEHSITRLHPWYPGTILIKQKRQASHQDFGSLFTWFSLWTN